MTPDAVLEAIAASRIVAVVRADSAQQASAAAAALAEGGITAVEIALTTPDAATAIREIRTTHPKLLVGAGTVLSSYDVTASVKAGAMFVVSPGYSLEVLDAARHARLLAIPGVLTPTEVQRAQSLAPLLKLFPAGLGGPGAVARVARSVSRRALHADRRRAARQSRGVVRGRRVRGRCGNRLCPTDALRRGDYGAVTERAREYVAALDA